MEEAAKEPDIANTTDFWTSLIVEGFMTMSMISTRIELEGTEEPHYEVEKILRWRKVKGTGR